MESQSFSNPTGWIIVLYGLGLSLIAAFVPHFETGYHLMFGVLLAGLFPYMVYAVTVPLLPGAITTAAGVILALAHTWLVVTERFIGSADYSNSMIYIIPIIMAILVIPLAIIALLKTDVHKPVRKSTEHT